MFHIFITDYCKYYLLHLYNLYSLRLYWLQSCLVVSDNLQELARTIMFNYDLSLNV